MTLCMRTGRLSIFLRTAHYIMTVEPYTWIALAHGRLCYSKMLVLTTETDSAVQRHKVSTATSCCLSGGTALFIWSWTLQGTVIPTPSSLLWVCYNSCAHYLPAGYCPARGPSLQLTTAFLYAMNVTCNH
jgi:hypothetical protein